MLRTRRQFRANLEGLEGKALMSNLPILTPHTLGQVVHLIDRAAGTFAKTHNENTFVGNLSQISYKVPYGHSQLLPTWQSDVGIYDPTVPGSGVAMVKQLKADLISYVQTSVAEGLFTSGARISQSPAQVVSVSSALPVLRGKTYTQVLHQIDQAAGTFAKTHNENAFQARLSQISQQIPYGHSQLLPTWQSDVGIYDPTVPGSGVAMVKQLKADLISYVKGSVADGSFVVR